MAARAPRDKDRPVRRAARGIAVNGSDPSLMDGHPEASRRFRLWMSDHLLPDELFLLEGLTEVTAFLGENWSRRPDLNW